MIKLIDVSKKFNLGKLEIQVLKKINFEIKNGEFIYICGPSGSGKSTLLNLIGGLDQITSGNIIVNNQKINKLDENQLANYRQKEIGFVFQSYNLIPSFSALKNVELPLIFSKVSRKIRLEKAKIALEKVGLSHRQNHNPTEMSGGEQQRIAIARALINNPKMILADEPTGNLDTKTSQEIIEIFRKMNKENNQTILMVTHNLEITKLADRVFKIKDGELIE